MAGKLHSPNVPEPLLHPYYRSEPNSDQFEQDQHSNQDQTEVETTDYVTARHYGYKHLLNDPIMTSQASIAFLCGKIQGLLRRNIPATIKSGGPFYRFLSHLISEAEAGLHCSSTQDQDRILNNIQQMLKPLNSTRRRLDQDGTDSESDQEDTGPQPKRRKSVPPMNCPFQPTLKKLLYPPNSNGIEDVDSYNKYMASFDPLLIQSCAFPNNPNYLGNGLLTNVRSTFLDDPNIHPVVLVWCPPLSHSIYYSNMSTINPTPFEFGCLEFPPEVRTPLTEMSACYSTTGHVDMVTRSLPCPSKFKNASFIRLTSDHSEQINFSQGDIHSPSLPGNATSVCLSPWVSGEWASAGHIVSATGDLEGFVHLYDVEHSTQAVWSGSMILDSYLDELHRKNQAAMKSKVQSDPVQVDLETYISEIQVRLGQLDYNPHYSWLRVNFGSCPGELCVCLPKRIVLVDTRQPGQNSMTRELLTLTQSPSNQSDSKLQRFNPHDHLACMPTRWIGDVYLVAGTTYSMVVLDKRMPGRCVLHWSHNLLGSPAYLDWTRSPSELRCKSDSMPTYFVPMASQYPPELSLVGLNFSSTNPVQVVGPSLMAAPLTNLLLRSQNKLPSCLYRHELISHRLDSSLCGLTTLCLPKRDLNHDDEDDDGDDNPVLRTVVLTSMGDLFSHSWYLQPEQADQRSKKLEPSVTEWLSNLSCISMTAQDPNHLEQPCSSVVVEGQLPLNASIQTHDLDPVSEPAVAKPDKAVFWSVDELPFTKDVGENSDHVQCSKHLIKDLQTIWDVAGSERVANFAKYFPPELLSLSPSRMAEETERRHRANCPDAASDERLDRLKTVIRNVLYDSSVEDSTTETEEEDNEEVELMDDDLDSSLFAMSDSSSMNLSSPD